MPRVIISSGHTNNNPGTSTNGLREVDLTRSIAKALVPHLRQNGVLTLSVPYEMEIKDKIDWINKTGYKEEFGDLCVEIHINEADGKTSGIEAWYEGQGQNQSHKLADTILDSVSSESGLKNQGAKSELKHDLNSLAFVSKTTPIGVLLECGYMDNPEDAAFLKNPDNIQKLGKGIAKGILKFLNIEYKEVSAPSMAQVPVVQPQPQNSLPAVRPPMSPSIAPRPQVPANLSPNPMSFDDDFDSSSAFSRPPAPIGGLNRPGFNNPAAPGSQPPGQGGSYLASRDERKEMIKNHYIKILGREPNQSDLNYFLNTGINEDQLIKKMIDSQEHADLVKARQEVLSTKANFHAQQAELIQLRTETADKSALINNLNALLAQKNIALTEYHRRLTYYEQNMNVKKNDSQALPEVKYNEPFMDKLFKFFSDRLG